MTQKYGTCPVLSTGFVPMELDASKQDYPRMQMQWRKTMADDDLHPLKASILDRIAKRLRAVGLEPATASVAAGLGPDLIRDWTRKTKAMPRVDSLASLAPVLKTTAGWLAYGYGAEETDGDGAHIDAISIPLVSWVAASSFTWTENVMGTSDTAHVIQSGLSPGKYIALTVKGDSMDQLAPDGSIIIVSLDDKMLIHRRHYVVRDGDKATFKRYIATPPHLEPVSFNPDHESIAISGQMYVVGRAVRVIRDI